MKQVNEITVNDLRNALYKEKLNNPCVTTTSQALSMGFDSATKLSNFLYRMSDSSRVHVLLRVINYIIKMKGGIYVEE